MGIAGSVVGILILYEVQLSISSLFSTPEASTWVETDPIGLPDEGPKGAVPSPFVFLAVPAFFYAAFRWEFRRPARAPGKVTRRRRSSREQR